MGSYRILLKAYIMTQNLRYLSKIMSYYAPIALTVDCYCLTFIVFKKVKLNYATRQQHALYLLSAPMCVNFAPRKFKMFSLKNNHQLRQQQYSQLSICHDAAHDIHYLYSASRIFTFFYLGIVDSVAIHLASVLFQSGVYFFHDMQQLTAV